MKKPYLTIILVLTITICLEGKKISWGRGSSSRRTGYSKPAPTSVSHSQSSVPKSSNTNVQKPSLFSWQERPASAPKSSKPTQTHSYPSSNTGMSGNKPNTQHQSAQGSHSYPPSPGSSGQQGHRTPQQQTQVNQQNHGYPSSQGMSGAKYPQQQGAAPPPYPGQTGHTGLSGAAPPPYSSKAAQPSMGGAPPPYPGNNGYGHNPSYGGGHNPSYGGGHNPSYGGRYHPQAPPPYSGGGYGYNPGPQMPGYFGNYGNNGRGGFGGVSRGSSVLSGVGLAGAGIGTVLTGLALWNLARSTGRHHHTVIYDNRGQPVAVAPDNSTDPATDSMLADLVNCSLTIDSGNATEVLAIPCAIATSFSPDAHVENVTTASNGVETKCTITVLTKAGREFMTTIPCSVLLNTAAENNVTEPQLPPEGNVTNEALQPIPASVEGEVKPMPEPIPQLNQKIVSNCTVEPGEVRDPINPCFAVTTDLTVLPLNVTTPSPAAA